MSVTGIICEYDPLHTGHAWLMARARAAGASAVVCAMSGNFTQRGGFAAADKLARAEMAVACGADLVLELPTVWAMSTAERFAQGGVDILTRTGFNQGVFFPRQPTMDGGRRCNFNQTGIIWIAFCILPQ